MKKYVTQVITLKHLSLLALLSVPHSFVYSAVTGTSLISFSGSIALREESHISNFFDKNDQRSWGEFVVLYKNEIEQLVQKINGVTRAPGDPLLADAIEFAEYVIQQFNSIIYIFEKHNGKSDVTAFKRDIETLNIENVFVVCKEKLEKIRVKAQKVNASDTIEVIDKLIKALEIKQKSWASKLNNNKMALLAVVSKRMMR